MDPRLQVSLGFFLILLPYTQQRAEVQGNYKNADWEPTFRPPRGVVPIRLCNYVLRVDEMKFWLLIEVMSSNVHGLSAWHENKLKHMYTIKHQRLLQTAQPRQRKEKGDLYSLDDLCEKG